MENQSSSDQKTVSAIPTEPVGSVPRSPELQEAMVAHSKDNITTDELNDHFDNAVQETIERF